MSMKIIVMSVLVDDQQKALDFYTGTLGFLKKEDVPMGEHRWLTVVSPHQPDGPELVLEPMGISEAKTYQQALLRDGIPLTMFGVDDIHKEHARLEQLGVKFTMPPTQMGPITLAVFEDTCGNLIQVVQK